MRINKMARLVIALLGVVSWAASASAGSTQPRAIGPMATQAVYLPLVAGAPAGPAVSPWLSYLNRIRALGNLAAVTGNATYSDGAYKHSIYMVKNDVIEHDEDPALPFYTDEGKAAAQQSNIMVSTNTSTSDETAIDGWILGPFHGVGILDPKLRETGFGSYREADGGWQMAAALNVLSGRLSSPPGFTFPVKWPADGATSWFTSYTGGEFPDPLSSCPGYTVPSGAPVYLMIGSGSVTPVVTATSFKRGGSDLEHCVYTEATYSNTTEPGGQTLGQQVLDGRDAIILMPRAPLTPGTYDVSITTNGTTYSWSFVVANP